MFPFPCDKCEFKFRVRPALNTHYKIVHLEIIKPKEKTKCEYCDYETTDTSYLKKHKMKHTGERPFSCPVCEQRFSRKFVLKEHCRRLHNYTKQHLIDAGMYCEIAAMKESVTK